MEQKTLKDVDWFNLITTELCEKDINFSFPDEESQEVTVINSVINERLKQAEEWLNFKLRDVGVYQGQEFQRVSDLIREAFGNKEDD